VILSSSYKGYGTSSLQKDCEELSELVRHLRDQRSAKSIALVGHSTGCQDSVYFMKHADADLRKMVRVVALQAPVSDREAGNMVETEEEISARSLMLERGRKMKDTGAGGEILCIEDGVPITADRWVSLNDEGGSDDMFSSDLSDAKLKELLGHMNPKGQLELDRKQTGISPPPPPLPLRPVVSTKRPLKTIVASSLADEYVPSHIDRVLLAERICKAMRGDDSLDVLNLTLNPPANHNLDNDASAAILFCKTVGETLSRAIHD
jgi:hypothetical protein